MSNDRYSQIFEDLTRELFTVTKKHGKRAIREAVRDAVNGNLLQEKGKDDIPPEDLEYPEENVWTLPAPEDEEGSEETGGDDEETDENDGDDELSEAAKRVASELAQKLERRLKK